MILEDAYVKFLIEHNITQSQYLLLYLVHKKRHDLIKAYKDKFPNEDKTMIGQFFIDDLFAKGLLIKHENGKVTVSNTFLEAFINKHTATNQIFDMYPTHFSLHGSMVPLSAMDRNVFAGLYDIAIQSSVHEHLEVVADLQYAIEHDMLNIGIDKFVKSKYWLAIRPKRLAQQEIEETKSVRDHEF